MRIRFLALNSPYLRDDFRFSTRNNGEVIQKHPGGYLLFCPAGQSAQRSGAVLDRRFPKELEMFKRLLAIFALIGLALAAVPTVSFAQDAAAAPAVASPADLEKRIADLEAYVNNGARGGRRDQQDRGPRSRSQRLDDGLRRPRAVHDAAGPGAVLRRPGSPEERADRDGAVPRPGRPRDDSLVGLRLQPGVRTGQRRSSAA